MLQEPMREKLLAMRLHGMADALKTQEQDPGARELSFLERLALLVDHQWNWRQNQALARRLHVAELRGNACVEEIDYRAARGLDKSVIRALAQESSWVRNHEHIFVLGPTGVGKSSSPARWRRRRAATDTRRYTRGRRRCFAIWRWHAPTEASDWCWQNTAASTCW